MEVNMKRTGIADKRSAGWRVTLQIYVVALLALLAGIGLPRPVAVAARPAFSSETPADNPPTLNPFTIPTPNSQPSQVTTGPDGNLWFTEYLAAKIGHVTSSGAFTEFPVAPGSLPFGIVTGPDDALWFTEQMANKIGRMDVSGNLKEFPVPTPSSNPTGITPGSDGNLWFTEYLANKIGRVTPSGNFSEFPVPTPGVNPFLLCPGPDGNIWFTEQTGGQLGKVTPSGVVTEMDIPTTNPGPAGIAPGPDGNLWFTEYLAAKLGRATPQGKITEFPLSNPNSRPFGIVPAPNGNMVFTQQGTGQIMQFTPGDTPVFIPIVPLGSATGISTPLVNPRVDSDNFMDLIFGCLSPDNNQVGVVTLPGAVKGYQGGYTGQLSPATDSGQPTGGNPIGYVNLQITPGATAIANGSILFLQPGTVSSLTLNLGSQNLTFPAPGALTGPTIVQLPPQTFQPPATTTNKPVVKFNAVIEDRRYSTIFAFDPTFRHFADKKTVPPGQTATNKVTTTVSPGATLTPGVINIFPVTNLVPSTSGGYVPLGLPPGSAIQITLPGGTAVPNWDPNNPAGFPITISNTSRLLAEDLSPEATDPGDYTFAVVAQTGDLVNISSFAVTPGGPDFSLGFDQSTVNGQAGTKVRVTVNINRTGGFTGNVTVTPPDPSGGIKAKPPDPVTTTDATAVFKLKIGGAAATGPHQLIFKGTDDSGREHDVTLMLVVQ
jgi:streptogramin lyase